MTGGEARVGGKRESGRRDGARAGGLRLPGLAGRRALVTGGSRGIGRATAVLLAGCGARVGIAYRAAREEAEETLRRARAAWEEAGHGGAPHLWMQAGDLAEEEAVRVLFERAEREFAGVELFVGNAGVWNADPLPLERLEPARWRALLDANLTSIYLTTREAVRRMGEGGRIVLLSSTAGQRGEAEHSHYAASKGAIISFVKSLCVELGPRGITVNAVAPGWVDTEMSAAVLRSPARPRVEATIPLRRAAAPEEIAGPIVFLLSDLASHITGEVLNVNGGSVLCG